MFAAGMVPAGAVLRSRPQRKVFAMSLISPPPASRRLRRTVLAAGTALCLAGSSLVYAESAPASDHLDRSAAAARDAVALPSFAPMVKRVLPAVVNISVAMKNTPVADDEDNDQDQGAPDQGQQPFPSVPGSPFDQFLRKFFEQQGRGPMPMPPQTGEHVALGSGFIIDPQGYVVTNNHVVQNAGKVTVILQDGTKHPAKVVGRDGKTDLALLKIDAKEPLPYVQWGDSNALQVGDWVLAVGNPFGLGGTVSSGIISARGRDIHSGPYDDFLQIDAAINRGNSGGPTFNLNGQVIGINTAIYSPNGGSVGIGFAIPSSLAKPVIEQLKEHGKVERGWLGVQVQEVTPEIAKSLGLPKAEGALVAQVTNNTPAEKAGVKQGDVILAYNGHEIAKLRDLPIAVAETPVGEKAKLEVWRDGHEETLEPVIAQMPSEQQLASNNESTGAEKEMGVSLSPLTRQWRERLHLGKEVKGVVVTAVAPDSPLAELGLERGDVIEDINQHPVTTPEDAAKELAQVQHEPGNEKQIMLLVNRHGINQYVAMTVKSGPNGDNG
jgi:serine protease Do